MDLVSVVIPTFNSQSTIELCLKSVLLQTYKNIEIIVVDNFSSDTSYEIAKKYTHLVFRHGGGRSAQRNFGFKKAKGGIFLYLDSDMVLSREVVQEAVKIFEENTLIVGLYIPETVEGKSFLTSILNFERSFYNETVIDAVRFVRRENYQKINGFDENLVSGEDWDLDRRIRRTGKVGSVSSPLFHLQYGLTLKKYLKKKMYYSGKIGEYVDKWGKHDEEIRKQLGFKYRFFVVFTEKEKWKRSIKNPGYTILMLGLKITIGIIYVIKMNFYK